MVIADGFFAFLTKEQIIATLRAITDHFSTGQLAFNDYGRMVVGYGSQAVPTKMFKKVNQLRGFEGYNDPRTPERWNPGCDLSRSSIWWMRPRSSCFPPGCGFRHNWRGTAPR